jgi:hypothetical protein
VGVDRRRGDSGVAEQDLHDTCVDAVLEQAGGIAVPAMSPAT